MARRDRGVAATVMGKDQTVMILLSMRLMCAIVIVLWSLVPALNAQGDPFNPPIGTVLIPRGTLDAWESYPSALTFTPGEVVTTVSEHKKYVVLENKTIPSFTIGDTHYIRLKEYNPRKGDPCTTSKCWVYQGRKQPGSWPNLVPEKVAKYINAYGDKLTAVRSKKKEGGLQAKKEPDTRSSRKKRTGK